MNPDLFQYPDAVAHVGFFKPLVGLVILLFASFVGVEIRVGNEDDER